MWNNIFRFYTYPDPVPSKSFVQVFVPNPITFSGVKLDVALYVVVTSKDPFRIYVLDGKVCVS